MSQSKGNRHIGAWVSLAVCHALIWLCSPVSAAPPAKSEPGHVDDEILQAVNEEARLNFLAARISDVGIQLPPEKANGFLNSLVIWTEAGRVHMGMAARDKLLARVPALLKRRRDEVNQVFGDKLPEAQALLKKPEYQAELFVIMLTNGVNTMYLPGDDSAARTLLGKSLGALFKEDSQRRNGKLGGAAPTERDQAWLDNYVADIEARLLKALKPQYQAELIRVWPILFPDGPFKAPAPVEANAADSASNPPASSAGTDHAPPAKVESGQSHPVTQPSVAKKDGTDSGDKPASSRPDPRIKSPKPAPIGKPHKPAADSTTAKDWIYPLRGLDAEKAAQSGHWQVHNGATINVTNPKHRELSRLALPVHPTGSFEIQLTFNRRDGRKEFGIMFPVAGKAGEVRIGGMNGQLSTIEGAAKANENLQVLNGKDQKLDISVKVEGDSVDIAVTLDGEPYIAFQGPVSKMSQPDKLTDPEWVGLAVHGASTVEFKDVRIRAMSGAIEKAK